MVEALIVLWETADRICGKRLQALLPTLMDAMERHGHLALDPVLRSKLLAISAATIDRALAAPRRQAAQGRRRRSGIGSTLRRSVPVRTFADWKDPPPGYFETDLVEHCGGAKAGGNYCHTLVLTDIATGWTECLALPVRSQTLVVAALEQVKAVLPFATRGLDTDNDSAFINETLSAYCQANVIDWTRSRAYKKNDQAWVEQKNGAVVRRLVGYGRYSGLQTTAALGRLYASSRLYVNFYQPCFKLKSKLRDGAQVRKHYHAPMTPYERILACPEMDEDTKERLRRQFADLDPVRLLSDIRKAQRELAGLEDTGVTEAVPTVTTDLSTFLKGLADAWRSGEPRPTHRRKPSKPRTWRTRLDPFEQSWPLLESWLVAEPEATAKELMERLRAILPDHYPSSAQLRTLQRRVKTWRAEQARRLVFGAIALHQSAAAAPTA